MLKNNKGFSLVELFAVLLIATTVLVPLLFSLVNNFEVNTRMIRKNAASLVSISALQGFDIYLPFSHFYQDQSLIDNNYVEYNQTTCDTFTVPNDQDMCNYVFTLTAQNETFDSTEYRVFIYPYYMTESEINALGTYSDEAIPAPVKDEMWKALSPTVPDVQILRITVWIEYDDERGTLVRSGVLSRD